jgi:hypothetical protein
MEDHIANLFLLVTLELDPHFWSMQSARGRRNDRSGQLRGKQTLEQGSYRG